MYKRATYEGLLYSVLEYSSPVWNSRCSPQRLKNRVDRIVSYYYNYEIGCMTSILETLKWESRKEKRDLLVDAFASQRSEGYRQYTNRLPYPSNWFGRNHPFIESQIDSPMIN